MSVQFDPRRRIYDLYSFDAPYDLEPTALSDFLQDYRKSLDLGAQSASPDIEDEEDEFRGLDLTLEEAEPGRDFADLGLMLVPEHDRIAGKQLGPSPVLGATLSQRKNLLKERIEELIADLGKREKLEEQMLEKAALETTGLEFVLGTLKDFSPGSYPSVDTRRTNLEREILTLKKAGWDEQLRCWRDIVALKKELREALEEYHLILSAEGL
jgi:hypothetical protein